MRHDGGVAQPTGFSYVVRKSGDVVVTHHGVRAAVLRGRAAERFLTQVEAGDSHAAQEVMARVTGNYKRGNERTITGRRRPGPGPARRDHRTRPRLSTGTQIVGAGERVGSLPLVPDWNARIIEEFRANEGKVGGPFDGSPMLILHTTGARTGHERVNPLVYQADGDRIVIFASKGGAPENPAWFHNLVANPDVTVEVGTETVGLKARVADGDERERLWSRQKELAPGFADYEAKTTRQIPVVVLERVG